MKRTEDKIAKRFNDEMIAGKDELRKAGLSEKQIDDVVMGAMKRTKDGDFIFSENWVQNAVEEYSIQKQYNETEENIQNLQKEAYKIRREMLATTEGEYKTLKRQGANRKELRSKIDQFLDDLNIDHIGEEELKTYRELLLAVKYIGSTDEAVDMILRISDKRNTAKQLIDTVYDTGQNAKRFIGKAFGKNTDSETKEYSKKGFLTKALKGFANDYRLQKKADMDVVKNNRMRVKDMSDTLDVITNPFMKQVILNEVKRRQSGRFNENDFYDEFNRLKPEHEYRLRLDNAYANVLSMVTKPEDRKKTAKKIRYWRTEAERLMSRIDNAPTQWDRERIKSNAEQALRFAEMYEETLRKYEPPSHLGLFDKSDLNNRSLEQINDAEYAIGDLWSRADMVYNVNKLNDRLADIDSLMNSLNNPILKAIMLEESIEAEREAKGTDRKVTYASHIEQLEAEAGRLQAKIDSLNDYYNKYLATPEKLEQLAESARAKKEEADRLRVDFDDNIHTNKLELYKQIYKLEEEGKDLFRQYTRYSDSTEIENLKKIIDALNAEVMEVTEGADMIRGMDRYASGVFDSKLSELTELAQTNPDEFEKVFTDEHINKLNNDITSCLETNKKLLNKYKNPQTGKDMTEIDALKNIVVQQVFGAVLDADKRAFGEKLSMGRYISQLLCATTLERNIISNTGFAFIDSLANNTAWVIDNLIALKTKRRTVGFENPFGGVKTGLKQARDSYLEQALNVDILHHDTSYLGPTKRKRTFTGKHMAGLERGLGYALSVPDEFYKGMAEERVRNSLEKIKKYCAFTDEDINTIAEDMAKYRTFQDDTALAKLLDSLKHDSLNRIGMYGFGLGDFVLPYTAVPANLVMRSIEYNPIGGLKAVYDLLMIFGGGDVMGHSPATSDEAVEFKRKLAPGIKRFRAEKDLTGNSALLTPLMQRRLAFDIARPLTGSMLLFLGANLRASGIIVGDEGEDEYNEEQYKKSKNANEYRINISALGRLINGENADAQNGDTLLNYGWFTPISTSMNIGAEITDKGEWNTGNFAKASGNELLKQFEDLPAFSSVYSVIRNWENSESSFVNFAAATGGDFVLSLYPSLLNQFGNSIDSYGRTPYKSDNPWNIFLNKIKVKSPILPVREEVPMRVDLFGQAVNNSLGSTGADMANNMLAPFKLSKFKSNELTEELDKLIKLSPDVVPKSPYREYNFEKDGKKYSFTLNDLDYQNFSILLGQTTYNNMLAFKHGEGYEKLSEQEKIDGYEDISRNTIYTVRYAWAMMKEGRDNSEVMQLLNNDREKYKQQAENVAKKSDIYSYLSRDGAKVEDVVIVDNPVDYPDTTVTGKIKYNKECIDKIKDGTFYEYRYNKYGKEYKSYAKNWTSEERYDKILYYRNLNKRLADGSLKDNSDIITGSYNKLSDYEKKLVDTDIERNISMLSIPHWANFNGNTEREQKLTETKDVTNDAEGVDTSQTLSDLGFDVPNTSQNKNRIVFKSVRKAAEQAKNIAESAAKLSKAAADTVQRENEDSKSSTGTQRRKFRSYYKRRYYRKSGYGKSGNGRIKFVPKIYDTNSSRFGKRFDLLIGTDYIKNCVIIAFSANELISLIENAGLMGIPIPNVIIKAIEVLKNTGDGNDDN